MAIGHLLTKNRDDMVAADIVLAIVHEARWVNADRKLAIPPRADMRLARNLWYIAYGPLRTLGHLAQRLSPDDPSIGIELVVDALIMAAQGVRGDARGGRGEAAGMKPPVNGRTHMADDVRSHR